MSLYTRIKSIFLPDDPIVVQQCYDENARKLDRNFKRFWDEFHSVMEDTKQLSESLQDKEKHREHH